MAPTRSANIKSEQTCVICQKKNNEVKLKTTAKNKSNIQIYIYIQNANKQANELTHNCAMWMCTHDTKCRNETSKKVATLILQLIMRKIQEQNAKRV